MRPNRGTSRRLHLAVALIIAVSVGGSLPTLSAYFRADDFGYLQQYWTEHAEELPRLLAQDLLGEWDLWGVSIDEMRPVVALSFRLNVLASGIDPFGLHLFNLLCHVAAALLVLALGIHLLEAGLLPSAFAALLFAAVPVHAEAIEWIASRGDLMVAVFGMSSLLAYVLAGRPAVSKFLPRGIWYAASVAAFALALFTKESAICIVLLLPAWDWIAGDHLEVDGATNSGRALFSRNSWRRFRCYLPFAGVLAIYLALRWFVLAMSVPPEVTSPGVSLSIFASRQGFYLGSLILPELGSWLLVEGSLLSPPATTAIGGPPTWLGTAALTCFALLGGWAAFGPLRPRRGLRRLIFFGPVWYLLTMLPMIPAYATDRHLYLPSAGVCLAASALLPRGSMGRGVVVRRAIAVALVLAAWSMLLVRQFEAAERGEISRSMQTAVLSAAKRAEPGSRFVILPALHRGDRWIWKWALPFALQPPLTPTDLYAEFEIIESPDAYCCPLPVWWADRQAGFRSWISDDHGRTTLLVWDPAAGRMTERRISSREAQERFARFAGGSSNELTPRQARAFVESFRPASPRP